MEHGITNLVIFGAFFLFLVSIVQQFTKKINFPYTIALLIIGFICHFIVDFFNLHVSLTLTSDVIFFLLLPLLLFESAFHINFHQFKLQFKTITFISTFGLLLSIFVIGLLIALGIGLPLGVAILFGAMISATDPIAVLALFKTLGAPKRLALIADGESMFNDATGVIAFKIVSGFVIAGQYFAGSKIVDGTLQFVYVFIGSMVVGMILGYITTKIIEKINNDRLIETALTFALALGSFMIAEHYLHLSGVISTVMAGITLGNIGKTKISGNVIGFIHEIWEYIGFISLSLVFFFAAYNIKLETLLINPIHLAIVVGAVLLGRAISVYVSFFISNRLFIFKDEPNVPLSWQHILNWGGLRGVIPLVLAYGIDDSYQYKDLLLNYTLVTLLFTLFVNGITIKWLLIKLKLHLPAKEEAIFELENKIFDIEKNLNHLKSLPEDEFNKDLINENCELFTQQQKSYRDVLVELSDPKDFEKCLNLQSLEIEKQSIQKLFDEGYINENVLNDFETELDLQQDAIEYPSVYSSNGYEKGGILDSSRSFRKKVGRISRWLKEYSFTKWFLKGTQKDIVLDRYSLLKARIISSNEVIEFFKRTAVIFADQNKETKQAIKKMITVHERLINRNQKMIIELIRLYPELIDTYQRNLMQTMFKA